MSQPSSVMQLVMSIAIAAAAIRGGSITFLVVLCARVSLWASQRKKASSYSIVTSR